MTRRLSNGDLVFVNISRNSGSLVLSLLPHAVICSVDEQFSGWLQRTAAGGRIPRPAVISIAAERAQLRQGFVIVNTSG
jgi:hypothetical protein